MGQPPDIAAEIAELRNTISARRDAAERMRQSFADALAGALASRDAQLASLQAEADARLAALEETTRAARAFEAEYNNLRTVTVDLERMVAITAARVEQAEARAEELDGVCSERLDLIQRQAEALSRLSSELESREQIIEVLREAAESRLTALNVTNAELERLRSQL